MSLHLTFFDPPSGVSKVFAENGPEAALTQQELRKGQERKEYKVGTELLQLALNQGSR